MPTQPKRLPLPIELPNTSSPAAIPIVAETMRVLIVRRASDISSRRRSNGFVQGIAVGKVTLIGGEPGLGKSQLMCALAAAVTTPASGGPAMRALPLVAAY